MDSATLVPVLGFAGTVVLTIGGIAVAAITNRSEKGRAAESTMEKVLEQRILLKDEKNAELKQDLIECMDRRRRTSDENRELRREVQNLKLKIQTYEGQKDEPNA